MEQKDFLVILRKYRTGTATSEEKKLIDEWCLAMEVANPVHIPDDDIELKEQDWLTVARHIRNTRKRGRTRLLLYSTGIAASLLIAGAVYFFVINRHQTNMIASKDIESGETSDMKRVVNTGNTSQVAVLPDGSEVTLAPESELRFSGSFDGAQREVYLEGEAFFNVSRDVTRPFLVYTSQVVTKVLGTTFTVKDFRKEKNITVAVRTGKVSVYTQHDRDASNADGAKEIILTPNQQVVFDKKERTVARMIVDSPQRVIPDEEVERIRLEDATVSEILAAMEKVYGVDIVYDEQVFASCILTTSISDGDLYNRLEAVCRAIDATFRIEENTIIVTGPGCRN